MREASSARIPNYVAAGDVKTLRRLMLLNNSRLGSEVHYFDIQNVKGTWYAWFYEDAMNMILDESVPKKATK
jgi:hypothetical protein